MANEIKVGSRAAFRGSWGRDYPKLGTIIGEGEKNGERVLDIMLDGGGLRWGYENQFSSEEAFLQDCADQAYISKTHG